MLSDNSLSEQKVIDVEKDENDNIKHQHEHHNTTNTTHYWDIIYSLYNKKSPSLLQKQMNESSHNDSVQQQPDENSNVSKIHITINIDGEYVNDKQDVSVADIGTKTDVPIAEETDHKLHIVIPDESPSQRPSSMTIRNSRLITIADISDIKDNLEPIAGYVQEPLVSLVEACLPLKDIIDDIQYYVQMALAETPAEPPDGLTIDESAAIRLYTIEWDEPRRSLYSMMNHTLKTAPRHELEPYLKYMKLFLTALIKLPCIPPVTVWRGVTKDLSAEFPRGSFVTWWAFSSCTTELSVLANDMYLGNQGDRTLFSVEAFNGRTVRAHSHFTTEDEILLLPGTYMEVQSLFSPAPELHIVHLKQIKPPETLLELPFEGASLYPPELEKVPWYKRKQTIIQLILLIVLCFAGIIVGAVIGSRHRALAPFSLCFTNESRTLRADYLWSFDCGDAREDITGLYNGTLVNNVNFVAPDFSGQGQALDLNRNRYQYVILPRSLNLTLNRSFTVSTWVLLAGYIAKTLLSDCNDYNPICIAFVVTDNSLSMRLLNWDNQNLIQEIIFSGENYMCHNCWMYATYSFDYQTKSTVLYLNGIRLGNTSMNVTTDITSMKSNETKLSYIGLNAVTRAEPFYGLMDRLCITYYVKNDSEILYEATVLYRYLFDTDDINASSGPNNIRARSQNVYRFISNNESSLLLNATDSYFQSNGFTLLSSNSYEFSISFWLRLIIPTTTKENSAISIFQLTSLINGLTASSYLCIVSLHFHLHNNTLGLFFPEMYSLLNIDNSSIINNTWVHIGIGYNSTSEEHLVYQNGQLIFTHQNPRYGLLMNNNLRLSLTVGGAYLNDSAADKPDNFEQMKCFARLPVLNYTNMYGNIDDLTLDARLLSAEEFLTKADPKTRN